MSLIPVAIQTLLLVLSTKVVQATSVNVHRCINVDLLPLIPTVPTLDM